MAASRGETLAVKGYAQLMRALRDADRETRLGVRAALRHVGEEVRADASRRAGAHPHAAKTAAGYKTRVRQRGIAVEQSLRKTTGLHPEWGAWQMRHALIPALVASEDNTVAALEHTLDAIAAHFNAAPVP